MAAAARRATWALALALTACARRPAPRPRPAPSVLTTVVARATARPLGIRAHVVAGSRLRLGFTAPGVLAAVLVHDGDTVKKGQLLARLDEADSRVQLRAAQIARDKARLDFDRTRRLVTSGALSPSTLDDARARLDTADTTSAAAAETSNRTRLTSPVSGTVHRRMAQPGETVASGAPVVVVDETDRLLVRAGVTDRELSMLTLDQPATIAVDGAKGSIPAKIDSLSSTPDPADGLYLVEIAPTVVPSRSALRPGALVTATVPPVPGAAIAADGIRLPLDAVVHRRHQDAVFVVDGSAVRLRPIALGIAEGHEVVATSGLEPGERVVTEGAYFLQDGEIVAPQ